MDKVVFYPREKLLSTDLNRVIADTESYGQEIISNLILGSNAVLLGLQGSGSTPPDEKVTVSPGLAYHSDGRKVKLTSSKVLSWNGTDGKGIPSNPNHRRIDVVCVRHTNIVGDSNVRSFIDINSASATFGQQIFDTVVTRQIDSCEFYVVTGTESENPIIPAVPTGYIPLFLVYIHSQNENAAHGVPDPTKVYIHNNGTGWTYTGEWRPNYYSDIDHHPYLNQQKITVSSLEDKPFDIPVDQDIGPGSSRSSALISPDFTKGNVVLGSIVDVTSPIGRIEFIGSGLNDLTNVESNYSGNGAWQYRIEIVSSGSPDTFRWRNRDSGSWNGPVNITGGSQLLDNGIRIRFGSTTGHTVGDAWEFDVSDLARQPVYGENNTEEPNPEFYIFGKITDVTPGAVTVTFYRGNPNGTYGVDYFSSNCNVDVTLTYPLRVPLRNLPTDVFRNEFQTGLTIDMNLERRIEDIENGITLDSLFLRRDVSAPPTNTLNRQVRITHVSSAPFVVDAPTAICTNLNADNLDTLHIGQNGPHNNGTGQNYIPYVDGSYTMAIGRTPYPGIRGIILAADGDCRVMLQGRTTDSEKLFVGYYGNNPDATHYGALQITSDAVRLISGQNSSTYKPLTFLVGGSERMRITTAGYVGIGTIPNEPFEAASSSGRACISDGGGSDRRALLFVAPTSSQEYARIEAYKYGSGGGGRNLIINNVGGGNVGIYTTSPSYRLDVNGTGRFTDNLYCDNHFYSNKSGGGGSFFASQYSARAQYIGNWPTSGYWGIGIIDSIGGNTVRIGCVNNIDGDWNDSSIRFVLTGSIGINNLSPSYTLDVSGDIRVTGDWYWSPGRNFQLYATGSGQEWSFDLRNTGTYLGTYWHVWSDTRGSILVVRGDNGNVGIGTTNPLWKLEVKGAILCESVSGAPSSPYSTGVSGVSSSGTGVYGYSESSWGVAGVSPSGYAGYFMGKFYVDKYSGSYNDVYFKNLPVGWAGYYVNTNVTDWKFYVVSSSKKFKKDIVDLDLDFNKILKLRPVRFKWNERSGCPDKEDIGLIAEEVEEIIPELTTSCMNDGERFVNVDYIKIPLFLIKVVSQQQQKIENLEKRIIDLESRIKHG